MDYKITLKAARVNAGFTQKFVAEKMGCSKESVSNWESGKFAPKATVLIALCGLYNVPMDCIILPNRFVLNELI